MPKKLYYLTRSIAIGLLTLITSCNSANTSITELPSPVSTISTTPIIKPSPTPDYTNLIITKKLPHNNNQNNLDRVTTNKINQYFKTLSAQGFIKNDQGLWLQTNDQLLADHQGNMPLPAASLTKVATSFVTLQTFTPRHQFITLIGMTGSINNGVLTGDLVIQGGQDPLFVWEEAFKIANILNEKGIKKVTGNLIITGKFYMNFAENPLKAGDFFRQALNSNIWPSEAATQFKTLPVGTAKPQIEIGGTVKFLPKLASEPKLLIRHYSFPVFEIVKKMNQYSNNLMADMLANAVGGPRVVATKVAKAVGVSPTEVKFINGSGLGEENMMSPRAVVGLLRAIEQLLKPANLTLGDVLTIVGQDEGILSERNIPKLTIVKSGTLDAVSALAGVLPTEKQGVIWFTIMNYGNDIDRLRLEQEALLNSFLQEWGQVLSLPSELQKQGNINNFPSRNEIID